MEWSRSRQQLLRTPIGSDGSGEEEEEDNDEKGEEFNDASSGRRQAERSCPGFLYLVWLNARYGVSPVWFGFVTKMGSAAWSC